MGNGVTKLGLVVQHQRHCGRRSSRKGIRGPVLYWKLNTFKWIHIYHGHIVQQVRAARKFLIMWIIHSIVEWNQQDGWKLKISTIIVWNWGRRVLSIYSIGGKSAKTNNQARLQWPITDAIHTIPNILRKSWERVRIVLYNDKQWGVEMTPIGTGW